MNLALIQARMGSSRFPGKVLQDLAGRPMLWHVVHRVRGSKSIDKVVIATTDKKIDDPIAEFCRQEGVDCFRGSEQDVLDRFYQAAKENHADVVVRITADCPLIDPAVIDKVFARFAARRLRLCLQHGSIHVSRMGSIRKYFRSRRWSGHGTRPRSLPNASMLRRICVRASFERRKSRARSRCRRRIIGGPSIILADLEFVRKVYAAFSKNEEFGFQEVFDLLKERPDLATIQAETITNEGLLQESLPAGEGGSGDEASARAVAGVAGTRAESDPQLRADVQQGIYAVCAGCCADFSAARQRLPRMGCGRQ